MKPSYPDPSLPEDFQDVLQSSEFSQEPPEFREEGRVSPFPLTSVQVISSRIPNNNKGANQTQDGKEVSDDLQFSLVCSQANSTRPGSRSCFQSQPPPSTSRITPEDALKVDQPQYIKERRLVYKRSSQEKKKIWRFWECSLKRCRNRKWVASTLMKQGKHNVMEFCIEEQ